MFSSFEAETPQIRLDIDRDKTRTLNISLADVFAALQATLGGYYVNDFNLYGRTWTVQMLAEGKYRGSITRYLGHLHQEQRRRDDPLSSHRRRPPRGRPAHADALQQLPRHLHQRRRLDRGCGPGEAIAAMQEVSAKTLPDRLRLRMDGTGAGADRVRRPDHHRHRASRSCSPICSSSASTRLVHPDPRSLVRVRLGSGRGQERCGRSGST